MRPALFTLVAVCGPVVVGCAEPFDVVRGELGPFRLAALGVHDGVASAAVYSGLGLYHEASPELTWWLDGQPLGSGYDVAVPDGDLLELEVLGPADEVLRGQVSVSQVATAPWPLVRSEVDAGPTDLGERAALPSTEVAHSAAEGLAMRLEPEARGTLRWMTVSGRGTLIEVGPATADVLAETIEVEDGEVVSRTPVEPGLFPQLLLDLGGEGANRWLWVDAAVGLTGAVVRHEGRLLEVDVAPAAGTRWVAATVEATRTLGGFRLKDVVAQVDGDLAAQTVACGVPGEPFRAAWVAEGRCPLPAVEGQRVVVELW